MDPACTVGKERRIEKEKKSCSGGVVAKTCIVYKSVYTREDGFYAEVVGCADLYGRVCRIGCIVFCGFLPFFLVGVKCS